MTTTDFASSHDCLQLTLKEVKRETVSSSQCEWMHMFCPKRTFLLGTAVFLIPSFSWFGGTRNSCQDLRKIVIWSRSESEPRTSKRASKPILRRDNAEV